MIFFRSFELFLVKYACSFQKISWGVLIIFLFSNFNYLKINAIVYMATY